MQRIGSGRTQPRRFARESEDMQSSSPLQKMSSSQSASLVQVGPFVLSGVYGDATGSAGAATPPSAFLLVVLGLLLELGQATSPNNAKRLPRSAAFRMRL
jgi:hypothetical protein